MSGIAFTILRTFLPDLNLQLRNSRTFTVKKGARTFLQQMIIYNDRGPTIFGAL